MSISFKTFDGTPQEQELVLSIMSGEVAEVRTSGGRSTIHEGQELSIKIKGFRNLDNYGINTDRHGSKLPQGLTFDFDGRKIVNNAMAHSNAFLGGMSFQQAATEYNAYKKLSTLGLSASILECLGWGELLLDDGQKSYFSVHKFLYKTQSESREIAPQIQRILAFDHNIITYFSSITTDLGPFLYDFHPVQELTPINDSAVSSTFALLNSLNIQWWSLKKFVSEEAANQYIYFDLNSSFTLDDIVHFKRSIFYPMVVAKFQGNSSDNYNLIRSNAISSYLYDIFSQKFSAA